LIKNHLPASFGVCGTLPSCRDERGAEFPLRMMFVYSPQRAENQPQHAAASNSTAAQSNLTTMLACCVRCMCTLRIYMLIHTPLLTNPSHSHRYVPHIPPWYIYL
jgi:hypothetical protein